MFGTMSRDDEQALGDAFARDGLVRIPAYLPAGAAASLHSDLRSRDDWRQVFNSGDRLFELDRPTRAAMTSGKKSELDEAVYAGARSGFQYRYETIRVPDSPAERSASDDPLAALALWLSSGPTREFLRRITDAADIAFADAQATAFSPGDFLTGHDDAFEGKNRRAAYVLSLTPVWRLEWGGLLVMHGQDDSPARAFLPGMNVLSVFRVPQMHSVSEVTRAAPYRRYSVTGWLRSA
ncbi:MAG: 2OG-Fe(II) oxygenase [Sphingomonas sp.]|nr:2OG-Fe(II) oxygenase [Sphingomonas sp.]